MRRIITALVMAIVLGAAPGLAAAEEPTVRIVDAAVASTSPESPEAMTSGYLVRVGDSLSGIAARFGISLSSLMRANGIRNPNLVYAGRRLVVPSTGGSAYAPAPAPQPSPSANTTTNKVIYVSIGRQRLFAYENGQQVYSMIASTGMPGRATSAGNFRVQSKIPEAYASLWGLRMPYWMGIYDVGSYENGIHALPINQWGQTMWGGYLGRPASYGCIVISTYDAATLYKWASLGTTVMIRY